MKPTKMFVYGILIGYKKDAIKAYLLNKEKYLNEGYFTIRHKKNSVVEGEILDVSEEDLKVFDLIEGVQQDFYRRYITVAFDYSGNKIVVWAYKQVEGTNENV